MSDNSPVASTTESDGLPELRWFDLAELHFDPQNPRLPDGVEGADDNSVLKWMLEDATLLDLMGSIAEHGFFSGEPLLLVPRQEGGLTVVEGNRRLAAAKLLRDPSSAPVRKRSVGEMADTAVNRPSRLSGVEFANRGAILDYLGFRHITGVKEWGPLSKARYLRQLWDHTEGDRQQKLRTLARKIGSQPYYVARLLGGLRMFDAIDHANYFSIDELNDRTLSFSLLSTALSYGSLADYVGIDIDSPVEGEPVKSKNLERLTKWMFEPVPPEGRTVLGESRNLKALAAVVSQPQARTLLEDGAALADAVLATAHHGETFTRTLRSARDRLDAAQKILRRVSDPNDADRDLLQDIIEASEDMIAAVNRKGRSSMRRRDRRD